MRSAVDGIDPLGDAWEREMSKPQSYPFMAIARRYGLDYGDVLTVADHFRRGGGPGDERTTPSLHNALLWVYGVVEEIERANMEFAAIQAGEIDWQTGEFRGALYVQRVGRALRPLPDRPVQVIEDWSLDRKDKPHPQADEMYRRKP